MTFKKLTSLGQEELFSSATKLMALPSQCRTCHVVPVGKRRDGGTRYWCLNHKSDATAKYGVPANACRASNIPPLSPEDTYSLNIDNYKGGIALWGAVPAVYDTTQLPMDRGIHIHARAKPDGEKEIDRTFRAVRIRGEKLPLDGILVSELDAIYYMVTSIFGYKMRFVTCSYCSYAHLDKDWFSVHPHTRHLCAGCGKHFRDSEKAIGNPILGIQQVCGIKPAKPRPSKTPVKIKQADYPGGIQIWGSNPAFFWTGDRIEEEGIHVHAFRGNELRPALEDTYGKVIIDGVKLNPEMVRTLMAQKTLPSIKNRIQSVHCPFCNKAQFSIGENAFSPAMKHSCKGCNRKIPIRGRIRKIIANPLPGILARIAEHAPREPQKHELDLMPETI